MDKSKGRIQEIEGIRGILSLIVVLGHASYFDKTYDLVIPWFWGCMEVFFVISGYLITDIVLKHAFDKENFYKVFIIRRCLRIWPLYYAVLITCIVLTAAVLHRGWMQDFDYFPDLLQYFFFLQNIELVKTMWGELPLGNSMPYAFGQSWSVALEEQFYILCAVLVPLILRLRNRSLNFLLLIVGASILASFFIRMLGTHWWLLIARFDGFGFGMILAILIHKFILDGGGESEAKKIIILKFCNFSLLVGSFLSMAFCIYSYVNPLPPLHHFVWGRGMTLDTIMSSAALTSFSLFAFGLVGVCVIDSGAQALVLLRRKFWCYLGKISYSTYLWHIPILIFGSAVLVKYAGVNETFGMLLSVIFVFMASTLSYFIIEEPFLKRGRILKYRKID